MHDKSIACERIRLPTCLSWSGAQGPALRAAEGRAQSRALVRSACAKRSIATTNFCHVALSADLCHAREKECMCHASGAQGRGFACGRRPRKVAPLCEAVVQSVRSLAPTSAPSLCLQTCATQIQANLAMYKASNRYLKLRQQVGKPLGRPRSNPGQTFMVFGQTPLRRHCCMHGVLHKSTYSPSGNPTK